MISVNGREVKEAGFVFDKKGVCWIYDKDICVGGMSKKQFKKLDWLSKFIIWLTAERLH